MFDNKLIVFYVPFGRAGSSFFQSLIDSHPEVLMIPSIIKFQKIFTTVKEFDVNRKVDYLIDQTIPHIFQHQNTREDGDFQNFKIAEDIFRKSFASKFRQGPDNLKNLIESFHIAFAQATGVDLARIKVVFIHLHRIGSIERFRSIYPQALWVSTVRDPRAAVFSQYSLLCRTTIAHLGFDHCRLLPLIHINWAKKKLMQLEALKKSQFFVVRFEDLILHTELVMREVAKKFSIQFLPCCLEPTLGNAPYFSSSGLRDNSNSPNLDVLQKGYLDEFSAKDFLFVETYAKWYLHRYNYKLVSLGNMPIQSMFEHNFLGKSPMSRLCLLYRAWNIRLGFDNSPNQFSNEMNQWRNRHRLFLRLAPRKLSWFVITLLLLRNLKNSLMETRRLVRIVNKNIRDLQNSQKPGDQLEISPYLIKLKHQNLNEL